MSFSLKNVLKKFRIFSQKSLPNFQETEISYISLKFFFLYFGKGIFSTLAYLGPLYFQNTLKHLQWNVLQKQLPDSTLYFSYISESNFVSSNNEKKNTLKIFLIFQEAELSIPKLKNILYFRKELASLKIKNFLHFFSNISTKKSFFYFSL